VKQNILMQLFAVRADAVGKCYQ